MKRTSVLTLSIAAIALLTIATTALLTTSCGTSDYLQSVTLTSNGASAGGFFNLAGVDGTIQLVATANYHSGKGVNVTNSVTWTVVPEGTDDNGNALPAYGPNTVPISPTGLMTGIVPICTWTDAITTSGCASGETSCPANPPVWEYTGYYQVTATYRNLTSQPVGVGVGVAVSKNSPVGGCGPT